VPDAARALIKGDLVRITNALGQVTLISSYDANGRPLRIQDPNGLVTTLSYRRSARSAAR
jgi:YD repeat-containing protein